jgi:AcrR family transcriptional regulator
MARPKVHEDNARTIDKLLDAALTVFARDGYSQATLSDIAGHVSITRPSLLHHFSSKDALYAATVAQTFSVFGQLITSGTSLASLIANFESVLHDDPRMAKLVLHEMLDRDGPGRELLVNNAAPLIDDVVTRFGGDGIRRDLLAQIAHVLLHAAADRDVRAALWKDKEVN